MDTRVVPPSSPFVLSLSVTFKALALALSATLSRDGPDLLLRNGRADGVEHGTKKRDFVKTFFWTGFTAPSATHPTEKDTPAR